MKSSWIEFQCYKSPWKDFILIVYARPYKGLATFLLCQIWPWTFENALIYPLFMDDMYTRFDEIKAIKSLVSNVFTKSQNHTQATIYMYILYHSNVLRGDNKPCTFQLYAAVCRPWLVYSASSTLPLFQLTFPMSPKMTQLWKGHVIIMYKTYTAKYFETRNRWRRYGWIAKWQQNLREDWPRTSLNAMVNLRYCMTLKF